MAQTVTGMEIQVIIRGTVSASKDRKQTILYDKTYTLSDGTGSNQIGDWWWDPERTLSTASEDLDLNGTLTPVVDDTTLGLTKLKVYLVENLDTDTGDTLLLKQGAANPATTIQGGTTPTLTIGPGGLLLLVNPIDGYALTAGSADTIAMEATDNSTYKVLAAGVNA